MENNKKNKVELKVTKFFLLLITLTLLISIRSENVSAHDMPPGSDPHGHMLLFDGSRQLVNLGEIQLPDPYNGMTVEAHVRPIFNTRLDMQILASIEGGDFTLFVNYDDIGEDYSFAFALYTAYGHTAGVVGDPIECDRWYHVAGVYDGTYISLYINGELEGMTHDVGYVFPALPVSPMYMGAQYQEGNAEGYYHGWIDEARLWNYPRTQAEIHYYQYSRVQCDSSGLVGYWDLDDPSPSETTQIVGNCAGDDGVLGFTEEIEDADPVWCDSERPYPPPGGWKITYLPILMFAE